MSNPWFRLYAEFAHDPKVQMLSEAMQRRLVMLMCMRCSNVTVTLCDEQIAFQLRITDEQLAETKALFVKKGFIDDAWNLVNWEKRQFKSDHDSTGAERQKRFRENQKNKSNALRDVTVTPPDTDTDTDIEAKASLSSAKLPPCPHTEIIDLFAKHLPALPQPKPELWSGARSKALSARWKWLLTAKKRNGDRYAETPEEAIAFLERYFAYVAESDFLTGRNGVFTSCDLGWLVNEANFSKVLQGNYENKLEAA